MRPGVCYLRRVGISPPIIKSDERRKTRTAPDPWETLAILGRTSIMGFPEAADASLELLSIAEIGSR